MYLFVHRHFTTKKTWSKFVICNFSMPPPKIFWRPVRGINLFFPRLLCNIFTPHCNASKNFMKASFTFYTFWNHHKTKGFLVFSGSIKREGGLYKIFRALESGVEILHGSLRTNGLKSKAFILIPKKTFKSQQVISDLFVM